MVNYKDDELTQEEIDEIYAGISQGKVDEMLDKLGKEELKDLKEKVNERELSLNELDNVMAGIPQEMVEKVVEDNLDIYRSR